MAFFEILGKSLASCDLILAALFLWITFFFAARSAIETAAKIFSVPLLLFAILTATSSFFKISLFTNSLFLELLNALLAVVVTGM